MFAVCVYRIYNTLWAYEEMSRRTARVLGYKKYWEHPELSVPADIPVPSTVSQSYTDLFQVIERLERFSGTLPSDLLVKDTGIQTCLTYHPPAPQSAFYGWGVYKYI